MVSEVTIPLKPPSSHCFRIYTAIDRSQLSLFALLDVSAAFDVVDHELLLQRLQLSSGIDGTPFNWIKSYLTDRTQMVILGNTRTNWVRVKLGVPQRSVQLRFYIGARGLTLLKFTKKEGVSFPKFQGRYIFFC